MSHFCCAMIHIKMLLLICAVSRKFRALLKLAMKGSIESAIEESSTAEERVNMVLKSGEADLVQFRRGFGKGTFTRHSCTFFFAIFSHKVLCLS